MKLVQAFIDFVLFCRRGNTALHECFLLGLDGAEPLRILLNFVNP
ncbi:unnamed protein product, partial [Rotaria sp. Silwood1]